MKQVQITEELFRNLLEYFFSEETPAELEFEADEIRKQLNEKLDRLISHELFEKYKRASTPDERERARKAYIKQRGILPSFCTVTEVRDKTKI